jgi:RNA polymerase sigma-70 factor (ECF subfamily)
MDQAPLTRASLLVRIRDGQDNEAWQQFVQLYAPLIYGYVRKRGVQDADAADLMQDVLRSVAQAARRLEYDPRRGTFRGWLYTVTRNKLYNFLSSRRHHAQGSGDSGTQALLEAQPAEQLDDGLWDREYERRLFAWAADEIEGEFQPRTWRAFWMTAVDGKDAQSASAMLGLSPGAVYVAKSRVLARLRQKVRELQAN